MVSRVVMIGTSNCPKCVNAKPKVISHCEEFGLPFYYFDLTEAPAEYRSVLKSQRIMQAPALIIYDDEVTSPFIYTGEDIAANLFKRIWSS